MKQKIIAVIGLGYVGLPLAIEFGKSYKTIGFDLSKNKINQYKKKNDQNFQITRLGFRNSKYLNFTSNIKDIRIADYIIVTVPTPIDKFNKPDLSSLKNASKLIGKNMKKNSIIIFESTVYPGATEEFCVPILEKYSKLKWKKNFNVGYSPERINPGDKKHTLTKIVKVVSGDTTATLEKIYRLYNTIIKADIFKTKSIKIAEAAKVIENTQRDLNIALVNELSIIFNLLNIDTKEVLEAAKTKWNFLSFDPGLVGGHCIGVDPYYLTYKSNKMGYKPKIILSGRKLNDYMGQHVARVLLENLRTKKIDINGSKVLILGFSFKENCNDFRNTKVIDIYKELTKNKCIVNIYDPYVNKVAVYKKYKIKILENLITNYYDSIIISVSHKFFIEMGIDKIKSFAKKKSIIFDIKSIFPKNKIDLRL